METVCLQPSSSCSFDGSLKLDQSDSESKWPEIPPVLNQNEDRKKNKYLRKDYLKVHVPLSKCLFSETLVAQSCEGKMDEENSVSLNDTCFFLEG